MNGTQRSSANQSADAKPQSHLFKPATRVVFACLAVVVAVSQLLLHSFEVSCFGAGVYIDSLWNFLRADWPNPLGDSAVWRVRDGSELATAISEGIPFGLFGSLGFFLMSLARTSWRYPRIVVFVGCGIGALWLPLMELREAMEILND